MTATAITWRWFLPNGLFFPSLFPSLFSSRLDTHRLPSRSFLCCGPSGRSRRRVANIPRARSHFRVESVRHTTDENAICIGLYADERLLGLGHIVGAEFFAG